MPMTSSERRDYEIAIRTTEILSQMQSSNWVPIQNAAHNQASKEWDAAHATDSWEKIDTRIGEALK